MKLKKLPILLILLAISSCNEDSADNNTTGQNISGAVADVPQQAISKALQKNLDIHKLADVQETAHNQFGSYVDKLDDITIQKLGFTSRQELLKATIGPAIPLLSLDGSVAEGMTASDIWRVPVITDGNMRSLLTVANHRGQIRIIGMGGEIMAGTIQAALENNPDLLASQRLYLLRSQKIYEDFLGVIDQKQKMPLTKALVPITNPRRHTARSGQSTTLSLEQILELAEE